MRSRYIRMARQNHGFLYEKSIIEREKLRASSNYTAKYDAFLELEKEDIPVQIKLQSCKGELCLGDYVRNKSYKRDFILHLGFYKNSKDNIYKEQTFLIDHTKWNEMCNYKYHKTLMAEFRLQTNLREDDERWTEFRKKHQKLWSASDSIVRLAPKRDHKTQLRLQLAISNKNICRLSDIFKETSFKEIRLSKEKNDENKIFIDINKSPWITKCKNCGSFRNYIEVIGCSECFKDRCCKYPDRKYPFIMYWSGDSDRFYCYFCTKKICNFHSENITQKDKRMCNDCLPINDILLEKFGDGLDYKIICEYLTII